MGLRTLNKNRSVAESILHDFETCKAPVAKECAACTVQDRATGQQVQVHQAFQAAVQASVSAHATCLKWFVTARDAHERLRMLSRIPTAHTNARCCHTDECLRVVANVKKLVNDAATTTKDLVAKITQLCGVLKDVVLLDVAMAAAVMAAAADEATPTWAAACTTALGTTRKLANSIPSCTDTLDQMDKYNADHAGGGSTYEQVKDKRLTLQQYLARSTLGTTAVVVLITKTHFVTANIGDSRCVIARNDPGVTFTTHDHKPTNERESDRITSAGGENRDGYVMGVVSVPRAIGNEV